MLTAAGLLAFALSHVLGLVIGAWPAVLLVAAATAALRPRGKSDHVTIRTCPGRFQFANIDSPPRGGAVW